MISELNSATFNGVMPMSLADESRKPEIAVGKNLVRSASLYGRLQMVCDTLLEPTPDAMSAD